MTLLAKRFHYMSVKRTEDRDWRATFKVQTIRDRLGVDHRRALELQETFAAYEATREDAERTALAMARTWELWEPCDPTSALLAIQAEAAAA